MFTLAISTPTSHKSPSPKEVNVKVLEVESIVTMATKQITQYLGTGRRKRAIARVYLRPGSGAIKINGRELSNYFPTDAARFPVRQPLVATETLG